MSRSPQAAWAVRAAAASIRIAGYLVPAARRRAFREEWEAELHYHRARAAAGGSGLALRCLGAFPHALWILGEEWMLDTVHHDLRFAVRTLVRTPGYALAATGTLALGIGAATALFSVVNGVLLRPLDFPEPHRLARVFETHLDQGIRTGSVTPATFYDWNDRNTVFEDMAAYQTGWSYVVDFGETTGLVPGARVFPNAFRILGTPAALGRTFFPQADHPDDVQAAVISHALWQGRLGGTPDAIGRRIRVEGTPVTIVGVMPRGFAFPNERVAIWLPYNLSEDQRANRRSHLLQVVARLEPGTTLERAQGELARMTGELVARFPQEMEGAGVRVMSLRDAVVGDVRATLWLLLGAVVLLLIIACCNVAGLGVARSRTREREVAVRAALGAGGLRISRLLLTESAVLALGAGVVGVLFAYLAIPLLLAHVPTDVPRAGQVGIDARVLMFALLVSTGAALASGMFPALRLAAERVGEVLKRGDRGSSSGDRSVLDGLVVAEVTFSVVLLLAAGLVFRSYGKLKSVDPGFTTAGAVSVSILPTEAAYPDVPSQTALYDQILARVRRIPSVSEVGVVTELPLTSPASTWSFLVAGRAQVNDQLGVHWNPVSPGYFRVMNIPLLRGRLFDARDRADAPPVMVIDEVTARRFFADEDPIGARARMFPDGPLYTVIGVVGAVRHTSLRDDHQLTMYTPYAQKDAAWRRDMTLVARVDGAVGSALPAISGAIRGVDPRLALDRAAPLTDVVATSLGADRFRLYLLASFAGLALLLTVVGLYGTLTYVVVARTRELAIRAALGARPLGLVASVVRRGIVLAALGGALGVVLAMGTGRLLRTLLFGIDPFDPGTLLGVLAAVGTATTLASGLPALRTARQSPAAVLNEE